MVEAAGKRKYSRENRIWRCDMGVLKNLWRGRKAASEEALSDEDRSRMGERTKRQEKEPVSEMSEEEKLSCWGRLCEMEDLEERLRQLQELAESGFGAAWLTMVETYHARAEEQGTELPFEKLEYCARQAADAGIPDGHTHLGMLCGSPLYGEPDPEGAAREYLLAVEGGSEAAAQLLLDYWNKEFHVRKYTEEENAAITAAFHESIQEALRPEIERLSGESSREALTALGLLHFYGIYFPQSLERAKEYFVKLNDKGSALARRMLANPVFEEDEDED